MSFSEHESEWCVKMDKENIWFHNLWTRKLSCQYTLAGGKSILQTLVNF